MKRFILVILVGLVKFTFGQARVSIANGDWNNPAIWSPVGVPLINQDTVIVQHDITFTGNLEVGIDHLVVLASGKIVSVDWFILHGSLMNDGHIEVFRLVIGDGNYAINNESMVLGSFIPGNPANENSGQIITDSLVLSEYFLNTSNGMIISMELISGDNTLRNNGNIRTDKWMHNSTAEGSGNICIDNCFLNFGTITGTLDVCDATPNTGGFLCDSDFGTITAGVTMCMNSSCVSLETNEKILPKVEVFPNPITAEDDYLTVEFVKDGNYQITIFDALGRTIRTTEANGLSHNIETTGFPKGCIVVRISDDFESILTKVIIR